MHRAAGNVRKKEIIYRKMLLDNDTKKSDKLCIRYTETDIH